MVSYFHAEVNVLQLIADRLGNDCGWTKSNGLLSSQTGHVRVGDKQKSLVGEVWKEENSVENT